MLLIPLKKILARSEQEKGESDAAYFDALMYAGEMVTKLTAAGLVAAIQDDKERHRYRLERDLVRASSLGTWADTIDDILTGPSSQFLDPKAWPAQRELTQRMSVPAWQASALQDLSESMASVKLSTFESSATVQGRDWFKAFVSLRNGTRGHGAPSSTSLGQASLPLERSILSMASNLSLFSLPWAYLHRNISGKYRVTEWNECDDAFANLKRDTNYSFPDGVHIYLEGIRLVALVESDAEGSDYWFVNGGFGERKYEMLSYITNDRIFKPSAPYMQPVEQLPLSETQGLGQLEVRGDTFNNLPDIPGKYVTRKQLENELAAQLVDTSRHFMVTLTGRGGIGKTSTALHVLANMIDTRKCPYQVVIWFSARDVDLLETGPKAVQPHGVSITDFAEEYARLLNPGEMHSKGFSFKDFLARQLAGASIGPTLFVFDNFETTLSPLEVFTWLDTYVRSPNKVLITSRDRQFTGDYAVHVHGMTDLEARELVLQTVETLGIGKSLTDDFTRELIEESGGHPYIIKLLLGEAARSGSRKPERIMAGQNEALVTLFERSYYRLSPAAQRVFLMLCNWRSSVPALAIEAVLLRPDNERLDAQAAIEELLQSSFIEESIDTNTGEAEITVPLAARLFGVRKLEVSIWRASIKADTSLLHLLGAQNQWLCYRTRSTYSAPVSECRSGTIQRGA